MNQLHTGELALLLVSRVLGKRKTPKGCENIPVMIENVLHGGNYYQVRAEGALINRLIRDALMAIENNRELKSKISYAKLLDSSGMSIEGYCKRVLLPVPQAPTCYCTSGCKTNRCPCRLAGFKCGTDCHPAYYKLHP
eukprot:1383423-Amorphochlora_amoeboformis.AAC.1